MSDPANQPGLAEASQETQRSSSGCVTSILVGAVVSVALVLLGEHLGFSPGVLLFSSPVGGIATVAILVALGERGLEELLSVWFFSLFVSLFPVSILVGIYWLYVTAPT